MFGRPRCREWTPLATQQLRLRSLIQIVGYNIRPPESCTSQCSFYLTLHHTTMSAPFYTSERICSPHPKWKEIDSEIIQRMSSTNIVIRIWCHVVAPSNTEHCEKPHDTIIQTWGVYFSGLRYIGANLALNFTSDCFKSNTLVFQMLGGYFCSYKSLKLDIIPPENEVEHGSLSSDSSGKTNLSKTLEYKFVQHQKVKQSRSISPSKFNRKLEKEYSKSHSPVERDLKQNFPTIKTSTSLNINQNQRHRDENEKRKNDPDYIYEHSPETLEIMSGDSGNISKVSSHEQLSDKIDLSETAENYDLRNESDGAPKYRYLALSFLKSEIRPSYNASKLQKLHLLQYAIKKKQEAVQEIKERIYKKSALSNQCSDIQDEGLRLKSKSRSQRNLFSPEEELSSLKSSSQSDLNKNGRIKEERTIVSNGPRLTLKLNDLLSFKAKPSPFQRSEHVRLTKQLEILRFKRIILSDEHDRKLANIRRLKEIHAKLLEENQDVGLELLQSYHSLSRRTDALKETKQSCGALRELAARSHLALANKRTELLQQLHQIFYIEQKDASTWTIINVPLPICGDGNPRSLNPLRDAVAAGFAAQATCLAAAALQQPLRYRITLLGSASKILDVTPDLPDPNIPLYARGGDLTLFRYAMFLLNKCVAQLLWGRGLPIHDMRPTLHNLQKLLTVPNNLSDTSKLFGTYRWLDNECPRTQSLRSLVASDRAKQNRQFNRFKDAVDGQSPEVAMNQRRHRHSRSVGSYQDDQVAMNQRRHRHSRSVGSYQDDQELPTLDTSTTSIMGSEPNIYNTKLTTPTTEFKTHISDSEISRHSEQIAEISRHPEQIIDTSRDSEQIDKNKIEHDKVVFTLGDDSPLEIESQRLVRISSNNQDELCTCIDDNVKKICTEIADFCTKTDQPEIHEGLDIAKHIGDTNIDIAKYMEKRASAGASEIENVEVCENCESKQDGVCDLVCAKSVTDVIVIPSAEAILVTGYTEGNKLTDSLDLGANSVVEKVETQEQSKVENMLEDNNVTSRENVSIGQSNEL